MSLASPSNSPKGSPQGRALASEPAVLPAARPTPGAAPTAQNAVQPPNGQTARPRAQAQRRLLGVMLVLLVLGGLAGLAAGTQGLSWSAFQADLAGPMAQLIVWEIRAPRTLGAVLVGALLGLAGALAQGLFRNPLADPYLLGAAAGAGLAVVLVLAGTALAGATISLATAQWLERVGLVAAAFAGAATGVGLTLLLARGAAQTLRLLLAGVVVGVLLGAVSDLVTVVSPDALRGKQAFMLGSTSFIGWPALGLLGCGLVLLAGLIWRRARVLDALTLGEDSATSLGIDLGRERLWLVLALAAAVGLAVSQAGLVAFVGLVAPHIVRRAAPGAHRWLLGASAVMGAVLLLLADVVSRVLVAPQELPVGVVTAVLGGSYLFVLLHRGGLR